MSKLILLIFFSLSPSIHFAQTFPSGEIQKILNELIDDKQTFGSVVSIEAENQTYHFASGNMEIDDPYFIASISKLYTSAVLFKLIDQKRLSLDDSIKQYLTNETLDKLHVYKGKEYSKYITIRHLLTNTSGLSDYFTQKNDKNESLFDILISNGDTLLTFDQIIEMTKSLSSKFPPGATSKAYYSDSNFQLLGKIIQNITGKTMTEVYEKHIFYPLSLQQSYLFIDTHDTIPTNFYYKEDKLNIPKMMSSFQSDGGIVSTAKENLIFLKSYINGGLFSEKYVNIKTGWNKIFSPFQYGYGIMKFKFIGMPEMIGHSGANGSFAYYIPSENLYITGTINQVNKPQLAYQLIAKILSKIK